MAAFDTVRCFHALPISPAMGQYIIRADGQVSRDAGERRWDATKQGTKTGHLVVTVPRWVRVDFSGSMELSVPIGGGSWLTLVAVFGGGQLQPIRRAVGKNRQSLRKRIGRESGSPRQCSSRASAKSVLESPALHARCVAMDLTSPSRPNFAASRFRESR
jgi:hypothetical protein